MSGISYGELIIKSWLNQDLTGTQRLAFLESKPCLSETLKISVEQARP
jgi:hypothetical protein